MHIIKRQGTSSQRFLSRLSTFGNPTAHHSREIKKCNLPFESGTHHLPDVQWGLAEASQKVTAEEQSMPTANIAQANAASSLHGSTSS
jgi:hypothetical protein